MFTMTRGIAFVGLLAIGLAAQNILHYARYKRARREQNRALQTWETEGGAVPTGPSQPAAQVAPARPSPPERGVPLQGATGMSVA
jgi:hypothetical protein